MRFFIIYILSSIYHEQSDLYKIGLTTHPIERLQVYNTGEPPGITEKKYIKLWKVHANTPHELQRIEKRIHDHFLLQRLNRINGNHTEWFHISLEKLTEYIEKQDYIDCELSSEELHRINYKGCNYSIEESQEAFTKIQEDTFVKVCQNEDTFKKVCQNEELKESEEELKDSKEELKESEESLQDKFKRIILENKPFRRIQLELWDNMKQLCNTSESLNYAGIIQWPTGTGKTYGILIIIILLHEYYKKNGKYYKGLLISPKNDILNTTMKHFNKLKEFGINIYDGSNAKLSSLSIPTNQHLLILATHQALTMNNGLNKLTEINHIHYDEVHRITGYELFTQIKSKMIEWNTDILTGTSATPITSSMEQENKLIELFGNGSDKCTILHKCNVDEAVREKWIATPKIHIVLIPHHENIKSRLCAYVDAVISKITLKNVGGKYIIYTERTEHITIILEYVTVVYPDIKFYGAIDNISYDKSDTAFIESEPSIIPNVLIACQKYREGSDIASLELTGKYVNDGKIHAHIFIQIMGRGLRIENNPDKEGWIVIVAPIDNRSEDDILDSIILSIIDSTGKSHGSTNTRDDIKQLVDDSYIYSLDILGKSYSNDETIDRINAVYQRKKYESGDKKIKMNVVREINQTLGFKSKEEYEKYGVSDNMIHPCYVINPDTYFKDNWICWFDFLGIDMKLYPKTKTEFVIEWKKICENNGWTYDKDIYTKNKDNVYDGIVYPDNLFEMYPLWTEWNYEFKTNDDYVW
jgi:superfamily II DNA or RNA helicase